MTTDLRNAWQRRAALVALGMPMNPPEGMRIVQYQSSWRPGDNSGVAAMLGDEVIGILTYLATSMYRRETDLLYVKPEYRRRGIGTLLWQELKRLMPGIEQSGYRSDAGEAWKNAADPKASPRYKEYQADWGEEDGAAALDLIQERMDSGAGLKAAAKVAGWIEGKDRVTRKWTEKEKEEARKKGQIPASESIQFDPWWEQMKPQFPQKGSPGIKHKTEQIKGKPIECLMYYDGDRDLVGILTHYPQDIPPYEKAGNVLVVVAPGVRRQGVGTKLLQEGIKRWPKMNLHQSENSPQGKALVRSIGR